MVGCRMCSKVGVRKTWLWLWWVGECAQKWVLTGADSHDADRGPRTPMFLKKVVEPVC
ncbi:hypothetical protein Hanom_Chr04g00351241 [Helianthus anomalus]